MKTKNQDGLTLVELMIAMALGTALIYGVIQVFLSGRSSLALQQGMARMQEGGRFALHFLQRDLRMAGFPLNIEQAFFVPFVTGNDETGNPATRDGGTTAPDTITVMYRSDTNCAGITTAYGAGANGEMRDFTGALYTKNQFQLIGTDLICRPLGANNLPIAGQQETYVEGINNFQIQYGIDTTGDFQANLFLNASSVNSGSTSVPAAITAPYWEQIVAVRVAFLANSLESVGGDAESKSFALLDAPIVTFTDRMSRNVFRATIEIRNRIP